MPVTNTTDLMLDQPAGPERRGPAAEAELRDPLAGLEL
jgi:hypothetical protein